MRNFRLYDYIIIIYQNSITVLNKSIIDKKYNNVSTKKFLVF